MTGLPMKQSLEELLEEAGKVRQEIEDAREAVRNGKPPYSLREADKEMLQSRKRDLYLPPIAFVKNNNANKEDK